MVSTLQTHSLSGHAVSQRAQDVKLTLMKFGTLSAVQADAGHVPAFEAWAALERSAGNEARASDLEKQGAAAVAKAAQRARGS